MKVGDEINCLFCNKHVFLVKKSVMDGWKKVGDILVCSSCGKTLEDIKESDNKVDIGNEPVKDDKLAKLANFLGTEKIEKKTIDTSEKTFCRDCVHYIKHPFFSKCGLYHKEVNPMDDCSSYEKTLTGKEDK
jgi:hypothetical protein